MTRQEKTGTTNIETRTTSIPPNDGMAIGNIISEPRPVDVKIGSSARMVVALITR